SRPPSPHGTWTIPPAPLPRARRRGTRIASAWKDPPVERFKNRGRAVSEVWVFSFSTAGTSWKRPHARDWSLRRPRFERRHARRAPVRFASCPRENTDRKEHNMHGKWRTLFVALFLATPAPWVLTGCERNSSDTFEDAGRRTDERIEDARDATRDAIDDAGDRARE